MCRVDAMPTDAEIDKAMKEFGVDDTDETIDLVARMRMWAAGMKAGNINKLAAFDTISDVVDGFADEVEGLLKDQAPFKAQIDQRKTYEIQKFPPSDDGELLEIK